MRIVKNELLPCLHLSQRVMIGVVGSNSIGLCLVSVSDVDFEDEMR
jgi:hypothetical protein